MTKPKKTKIAPSADPKLRTISVRTDKPESQEARFEAIAKCATSPEVYAAITVRAYANIPKDELATDAIITELAKEGRLDTESMLAKGERMLVAHAHALDAIFCECATRARANMGEYTQTADLYLRVGLRAQSQCRATWETLANIKNPPNATFVRQANIANGPQQVNNGAPLARAGESANPQNKLLEDSHGEWLDARAPGAASSVNPKLETVDPIDRAKDGER